MTQTKARKDPRTWDFVLTAFLVLLMIVLAVIAVVIALWMGFSAALCSEARSCSLDLVQTGTSITAFAPPVLALIFTVACVVRVTRRKISFGFGVLGAAMMVGAILLGVILFDSGMAGV